jgi:hypothetical protein
LAKEGRRLGSKSLVVSPSNKPAAIERGETTAVREAASQDIVDINEKIKLKTNGERGIKKKKVVMLNKKVKVR